MISLNIKSVTGNILLPGYEGGILVNSYYSSAHLPIKHQIGKAQSRVVDTLTFQPLIFSKALDKASAPLLQHFFNSQVIPQISFNNLTTGNNSKCYYSKTFYDVIFSHHEEGVTADGVIELYELHYMKVEQRMTPLDETHTETSPQSTGYDLVTSQSL